MADTKQADEQAAADQKSADAHDEKAAESQEKAEEAHHEAAKEDKGESD